MTTFNEFHVKLDPYPDLQAMGNWNVSLECSLAAQSGKKGIVQVAVTQEQLRRLRSQHDWPNLEELKAIGESVWQSLMTSELKAAFDSTLALSLAQDRGMRLVVSVVGEEPVPAAPDLIRLQELPFEALYFDSTGFLAPQTTTPISRSLEFDPDREPHRVELPLRILVVIATPKDKPGNASMQEEKKIIEKALEKLKGEGGAVDLEFCEPTREALIDRLQQKRFHVVHFIGHGAFDTLGDDPSPQPYLCLEDSQTHDSDLLDAETLDVQLQGSDVRLMVMTACSSASSTPPDNGENYHARAFDGIAQKLIRSVSDLSAVVAMQFDLESKAAVTFSKNFYTNLLTDRPLDEIVALCRKALAGQMGVGHRAWVTPVFYSRCEDGKVFDVEWAKVTHDEQTQKKLNQLDGRLTVLCEKIAEIRRTLPQEMQEQPAIANFVVGLQHEVDDLHQERNQLLGETLRLRGGPVKVGDSVQCPLSLRLRTPAQIGDVMVHVHYPTDKVKVSGVSANVLKEDNPVAGILKLLLQNASQGADWEPDEKELATLTFQVQADVDDPILELSMKNAKVQRNGVETPLEAVNAVLFVN